MTVRLPTVATLCGVAALALGGCDDEPAPESATTSTGTSSTGAAATSSSSSSGEVEGSSTGVGLPGSSSSSQGRTTAGSGGTDDTTDVSESDTEGPGDPFDCESLGGLLITEFEAALPIFQVGGEDVVTAPLGPICMLADTDSWVLRLQFGPMDAGDWASTLRVRVAAAGTYDLGSDFGKPGSGASGPNGLSYSLQEGASTTSFDTSNQAGDGTLQVDEWPEAAGDDIAIRGDGSIAGMDGWRFQFTIGAVLP